MCSDKVKSNRKQAVVSVNFTIIDPVIKHKMLYAREYCFGDNYLAIPCNYQSIQYLCDMQI